MILGDLESPRLQNINIERLSKFSGVPGSQIFAKKYGAYNACILKSCNETMWNQYFQSLSAVVPSFSMGNIQEKDLLVISCVGYFDSLLEMILILTRSIQITNDAVELVGREIKAQLMSNHPSIYQLIYPCLDLPIYQSIDSPLYQYIHILILPSINLLILPYSNLSKVGFYPFIYLCFYTKPASILIESLPGDGRKTAGNWATEIRPKKTGNCVE